ncbi:MAG: ABC transporter permease [Chloroflexi bacterium]|nr:ABC transporter permease [Chloroflexota bacterium]
MTQAGVMSASASPPVASAPAAPGAAERGSRRAARVTPSGALGIALVSVFLLLALGAPLLEPRDPLAQELTSRLKPPGYVDASGGVYVLGTDTLGRDLLSRLIAGARVSLVVGLGAALAAALLGTALGLIAGFAGGWYEAGILRLTDVAQAIPYTILALSVIAVLGPSLEHLVLVLAFTSWVTFTRVVSSETRALRGSGLVLAARVLGATPSRIVVRHLLPQVVPSLLVLGSLMVGSMILFEATLSFLGLGVQPPTPSWGNMLLDGMGPIRSAWWVSFFPGLAILLAALGVNLLADWARDATDPRRSW